MKPANRYIINVIATGFITLTILSILLFLARKVCQLIFYERLVASQHVEIRPCGLTPEFDSDPNVVTKSFISAYIIKDGVVANSLGIAQDLWSLKHGKLGEFSIIRGYKNEGRYDLILFDRSSGLFVYYEVFMKKREWDKKARLYAGPKGVSKTSDKNLGRFSEPRKDLWIGGTETLIFFDKSSSCFFKIRWNEGTVIKSCQLPEVIRIGGLNGFDKDGDSLSLHWWSPMRKETPQDEEDHKQRIGSTRDKEGNKVHFVSPAKKDMGTYSKRYTLILDESGKIRRLDNETLEVSGPTGYLPSAPPFESFSPTGPEDLLAYTVQPFTVDNEYKGTIVGSISREALGLQVAVFDRDGRLVGEKGVYVDPFDMVWGPTLTIINYLLENLQPAFLGLASYFTASTFEATAGHRGIFILPNSFVAMFSRDAIGIILPLFAAMLIISPSIILGVLLGRKVYKDAALIGLPGRARRCWLFGAILFGISAYIAYKLTRPQETLVTCQNCGKLRRPDMDRCHRCGSKWLVPELIPPTWRVINGPGEKVQESLAKEKFDTYPRD